MAEIGAFVDYPVSYSNVTTNFNSQITNIIEEDTTGWRILSIKNDEISIISTGVPLEYGMYYSKSNTEESVNNDLSNLNKVLNTNQTVKSEGYSFFTKSGFENNTFDLTKVFNTGLEDTSSVHAMTDEELITTYNALTNKELTIDDLYSTTTYLGNGSLKLDDDSIARLLGHKDTRTIPHYRRLRNEALAEDTKAVRDEMNELLAQYRREKENAETR